MNIELPLLPYPMDALEPVISKNTIEFHYGKHHQTYVTNLNKLIIGTPFENASLDQMVLEATGGIFNNAAQVWNHTFYWNSFKPNSDGLPSGKLADVITNSFGSFDVFKEKFSAAALSLFGAGWAWLVLNPDRKLEIIQESNAGNPLRNGHIPLLTCDVWEHAYYLDYQNRRADYINGFWKLINWEVVEKRLG